MKKKGVPTSPENSNAADGKNTLWADAPVTRRTMAMAFAPATDAPPRSLWAMSLAWTNDLIRELLFVREAGARAKGVPKIELPYAALRAALHIRVRPLLRLESSLGLSFLRPEVNQQPVFALVNGSAETAENIEQTLSSCLIHWLPSLTRFIGTDMAGCAAINRIEVLVHGHGAFVLKSHTIHTLPWQSSAVTHTTAIRGGDSESDRFAYAALAEEAAIALVGHELLPRAGALRRILDGDPGRNQAMLLTPPIRVDDGEFSICVRLHVETVPAFEKPVVVFDLSKRRWVGGALKDRFGAKTIRGHVFVDALPDRVLSFSAHRKEKVDNRYQLPTCEAFGYIAGAYGLPLHLTSARDIAVRAYADVDQHCQVRLTYANGITAAKHSIDAGVPERDWLDAYQAAAEVLRSIGLIPMNDFKVVRKSRPRRSALAQHVIDMRTAGEAENTGEPGDARKIINIGTMLDALRTQYASADALFSQRYGFSPDSAYVSKKELSNNNQSDRLAVVQAINELTINRLNESESPLLLLIHDPHTPKVEITLVKDMASILFNNGLQIETSFLPPDTHGPQESLPENKAGNEKRFKARAAAWNPLAAKISAATASGRKIYCLVMAPEWYATERGRKHDDPVNKPAARNALITRGGAMSQYLLPLEKTQDGRVLIENFSQRLQSALKDLLLAHSGSVIPFEPLAGTYFPTSAAPQEVVGITIIRSQGGRVNKSDPSFVLAAFRLALNKTHCEVRFAYARSGALHISPWENLAQGVATIAGATPCWLSDESDGRMRQTVTKERYQEFVKTVLDDCSSRKTNAVVLIDSTNASSLWPWLTDQRIDPGNISIGSQHRNMQHNWKGLRIVRTRQQIAPLLVDDKVRLLRHSEDGPVMDEISVPASPSGLFKVGGFDTGPQAFWSIAPTGASVKRGSSCYRPTTNTKRAPKTVSAGWMDIETVAPHTGQWPTPNAIEFVIGLCDAGDDPEKLATFCDALRGLSLHYDDTTSLPVPLFFERVVRQYITKFALNDAESKDSEDNEEI